MREAAEVAVLAREVPGMVGFFALVGSAIQNGRAGVGFEMLKKCGLGRARAWYLVDGWDRMIETESQTGWTPETVAMGVVIEDVAKWGRIDWEGLIGQF